MTSFEKEASFICKYCGIKYKNIISEHYISLSEFDKEYNSHDDKKAVGEDGAATFFSTVSYDNNLVQYIPEYNEIINKQVYLYFNLNI